MKKKKVGIILGGFTAERHVSVESGRNIYNKLAASAVYTPIPIVLSGTITTPELFIIPISMLLKDSADDIHARLKVTNSSEEVTIIKSIQKEVFPMIRRYIKYTSTSVPEKITYAQLAQLVDFVFIALHGRPGEDGVLQAILEKYHIPYNGSGVVATRLTIDKFKTNQLLQKHGIQVAKQKIVCKSNWETDSSIEISRIEKKFSYPFIAKPVDDGCSTAVMKIATREMLVAYAQTIFGNQALRSSGEKNKQDSCTNNQIPTHKSQFLIEDFIVQGNSKKILEITGGLVTHMRPQEIHYEIFDPSEVIASTTILSLEEKFLAGEGQNITPAHFSKNSQEQRTILTVVKNKLLRVAQILNLEGYARIDAFVKIYSATEVEVWIIEINALPAMTPATCIFHQCALSNYTPFEFIHTIIQYGLIKHQQLAPC